MAIRMTTTISSHASDSPGHRQADDGVLRALTGGPGAFVIRGGYGIYHSRLFQSVFSQNQLSIRTQPPNGYAQVFDGLCRNEISDPSCGFVFTPGVASYTPPFTVASAGGTGVVRDIGGRLNSTLLIPASNLEVPYTQQWNLTMERQIGNKFALQVGYNGNRGIGLPFFDSGNDALYPIDFTEPASRCRRRKFQECSLRQGCALISAIRFV